MNTRNFVVTILFFFITFSACAAWSMGQRHRSTQTNHDEYVCPMHRNIISDKLGNCSVCGMALVKKDDKATDGGHKCSCCGMMKGTKGDMKEDSSKGNAATDSVTTDEHANHHPENK